MIETTVIGFFKLKDEYSPQAIRDNLIRKIMQFHLDNELYDQLETQLNLWRKHLRSDSNLFVVEVNGAHALGYMGALERFSMNGSRPAFTVRSKDDVEKKIPWIYYEVATPGAVYYEGHLSQKHLPHE